MKMFVRCLGISTEAVIATLGIILWLAWSLGSATPTKFIYYNF